MPRNFRSRLRSGEKLYGTMITIPSPVTAEVLANVGFDWFFIDGEHGPLGTTQILAILQAVSHKVSCVVRVPNASEVAIKKMLDIGADGIIVPQVNDQETARQIVKWAKYAPVGSRGVGLARAHGYGATFSDYVTNANDNVAVIVQAEHVDAVANIESIVKVEGVDAIQLGPYDLSASMGKMGQIDDPEVVRAIERICSASRNAGLPIGCFGVTPDAVVNDIRRGANLICAGTDTLFLGHSASKMLHKIREN